MRAGNSPIDVLVTCLESTLSVVLKSGFCIIFLNGWHWQLLHLSGGIFRDRFNLQKDRDVIGLWIKSLAQRHPDRRLKKQGVWKRKYVVSKVLEFSGISQQFLVSFPAGACVYTPNITPAGNGWDERGSPDRHQIICLCSWHGSRSVARHGTRKDGSFRSSVSPRMPRDHPQQRQHPREVGGTPRRVPFCGPHGRGRDHRRALLRPPPAVCREGGRAEVRGRPGAIRYSEGGGHVPHAWPHQRRPTPAPQHQPRLWDPGLLLALLCCLGAEHRIYPGLTHLDSGW